MLPAFTGNITTAITGEEDAREAIILDLTNVSLGEYTLTEVSPPPGYHSLKGPVKITVEESGGFIVVKAEINGQESSFAKATRVDVASPISEWLITIKNDAGAVLPSTGGPGTSLLYFLGMMLTGITGTYIVMRKRKK